MVAYFKGWRRKVGCVTLVLACVIVAGWVRSYKATDNWDTICGRIESSNGDISVSFEEMNGRSLSYEAIVAFLLLLSADLLLGKNRPSKHSIESK